MIGTHYRISLMAVATPGIAGQRSARRVLSGSILCPE